MNVLDLRAPNGDAIAESLTAAQPAVARLACLAAAGIRGLETRLVRAEGAIEERSVQVHLPSRTSGFIASGHAAGRTRAGIARLTGCPAVAVDLRAGSLGWFG